MPVAELQRAKDHLKGSLMLSLENTASRMSHLARQEIYFDRQFGLDETLQGIERVTRGGRAARGDRPVPEWLAVGDCPRDVNGLQIPASGRSGLSPPRRHGHFYRERTGSRKVLTVFLCS